MNELLPYLVKSTLCLSLLYLAFRTVMRKESYFALNRMVLIAVVIFSFLIPLLYLPSTVKPIIQEQIIPQFPAYKTQAQSMEVIENNETIVSALSPVTVLPEKPIPYSTEKIIFFIYMTGMLFSFLVFMYGIGNVLLMLRKAKAIKKDGIRTFILEKDIPAFSFWRMIFISRADYMEHGSTILSHEQQHIRLGHFYDLLLMEMAKTVYWYNPIIYWLIQDLKAIHEFQADKYTLTKGIDARKYQLLIIEKGVGHQRLALANSFNHCQIKKRITMMNQSRNGKAWRWKVATFLPLLALLLMAFGREGEKVPPQKQLFTDVKEANVDLQDTAAQSKEKIYFIVEQMPEFPGGEKALREYIAKNVRYPHEATAKGIQGKVFVNFIITDQGKVIHPKIVRSVDPTLDAEALRIIKLMPDWIPGKEKGNPVRTSYTIPINFVLSPGPTIIIDKNASTTSTNASTIIGTWKLVSYNYGGGDELNPVSPGSERIKFITEKNFNWVQYAGNDKIVVNSAGGTYTFSDNTYTEKIEFGAQGMSGYIGKEHKFTVNINNNKMELSGELADGLRIKELWERYEPSDKTSMGTPSAAPQKKVNNYLWIDNDGKVSYNNEQISFETMAEKVKSGINENQKLVVFIEEGKLEDNLAKVKSTLKGIENLNVSYNSFNQEKQKDSNGLITTKVYTKTIDVK